MTMTTKELMTKLSRIAGVLAKQKDNRVVVENGTGNIMATVRTNRENSLDTDFTAETPEKAFKVLAEYAETPLEQREVKRFKLLSNGSFITDVTIERNSEHNTAFSDASPHVYCNEETYRHEIEISYAYTNISGRAQVFSEEYAEIVKRYLNVSVLEVD